MCVFPPAGEVEALWEEYEAAASPEALLVKDFDKLEMIVQVWIWSFCLLLDRILRPSVGHNVSHVIVRRKPIYIADVRRRAPFSPLVQRRASVFCA